MRVRPFPPESIKALIQSGLYVSRQGLSDEELEQWIQQSSDGLENMPNDEPIQPLRYTYSIS